MSRRKSAALRATISFAACLAVAGQAGTVMGAAGGIDLEQTIGTVTAVDAGARRVAVMTGCGHALRVMVFHAGTECRIEVGSVGAPLASLRRGQIVAVRHRNTAQQNAAERIATLPAADVGKRK